MRDLSALHPAVRDYYLATAEWMRQLTGGTTDIRGRKVGGIVPTVTSTYRSLDEQQRLYANRANNPYPVSRPGNSAHQYGLAVDSDVPDRHMPYWIAVRRAAGWYVPDNDEVHAGVPNWQQYVGL